MTDAGLHICHLGKYYPPAPGGIEAHVQTLARAQAALGHRVQVICVNHGQANHRVSSTIGFQATPTENDMDGAIPIRRIGRRVSIKGLDICSGLHAALRSIGRQNVDIVHLHTPNPTMLLALARTNLKIPMVIMHHSDIIRQRVLKVALRPFEHLVYNRAACILCSNPLLRDGSNVLQKYVDRVRVVPMGIDLDPYLHPSAEAVAFSDRLRSDHGSPLWVAVGRLVYYKGLHTAIRALAGVPGKLLIIGSGPLKSQLLELAAALGVADRVVWMDYAQPHELVGAYHAATAFWFPSNARSEAFGLVQVEAMASGCPVINTNISGSGVPWVSRHEQSGLTVPIDDPEAFTAAARRLLEEPGLRQRLSDGARQLATSEFDQMIMGRRSVEIYHQILNHTCHPRAAPTGGLA